MNSSPFNQTPPRLSMPARRALLLAAAGAGAALFLRRDALTRTATDSSQSKMVQYELDQASMRGELCSPTNAIGVGLRGEYFAAENFEGPVLLTRTDPIVDFDASLDWPADLPNRRPRSVRWSGWVKPPVGGAYRLHCDVPGARVLVSRVVQAGEGAPSDPPVDLPAGRFIPLVIEVRQLSNLPGRVRLEWTAPHGARYVIPRQLLHLPSDTVSTPVRT